jgi:hypothetical protein
LQRLQTEMVQQMLIQMLDPLFGVIGLDPT